MDAAWWPVLHDGLQNKEQLERLPFLFDNKDRVGSIAYAAV